MMPFDAPRPSQEGLLKRDLASPTDPSVIKLHALAEATHVPTFGFLGEFQRTSDPNVERFYGPSHTDRLSRLQYDISTTFVEAPNSGILIPVESATWGSDIEFGEKTDRKLNEDSILTIPFGDGRILSAVFDGASSQRSITGLDKEGVKGAWLVSHLASVKWPQSEVFKNLLEDPSISAKDIIIELNSWLRSELSGVEGVNYNDVLYIPGMAATIALIDTKRRKVQIAHAADTMAIAEYDDHYEVLTNNLNGPWDRETEDLVDRIVQEYRQKGIKITYLEASQDKRVKNHLAISFGQKINTPQTAGHRIGTGIVNGMPELVSNNLIHTAEIDIPINGGLKLHLLSDGIYSAWTNRRDLSTETSFRKLLGALNSPSYQPGTALHAAFARLKIDPDAQVIRRIIKAHDDASRITLTITRGEEHNEYKKENQRLVWSDYAEITTALQEQAA